MRINFKVSSSAMLVFFATTLFPVARQDLVFAGNYPFNDTSLSADARAADLVSRLTLDEKISQMGNCVPAIPRLGIERYNYRNEACHGIVDVRVTVFPQAIGLSASFDPDLEYEIANAISDEARALSNSDGKGLSYWSPTINMCRDPRWGRNEECYGEDPYLAKKFAVSFVKGMQGSDPKYLKTIATVKHFACNNVEYNRAALSSSVDERSLREYYFPVFRAAVVEGKVGAVMSAYNALNGVPCSADKWLLTDVLRKEWGFSGYVVSDCGATDFISQIQHYVPTIAMAAVAGCKAGCDMSCGGTYQRYLPVALASSLWSINEADIDTAVKRIFRARILLGDFDPPSSVPYKSIPVSVINSSEHQDLALKAARESIVLLKNNGILPLDTGTLSTISVIGPNANVCAFGGYSGMPVSSVTPLRGIIDRVGGSKAKKILYTQGCDIYGTKNQVQFDQAVNNAMNSDVVIMFMGLSSEIVLEGYDMGSLALPGYQEELIKEVYSVNPNVIVVLINGNPLSIIWTKDYVPAIVEAWYAGQSQGTAIAGVLFGDCNPAGRLTQTWVGSEKNLPDMQDYTISNNRTYQFYTGELQYPFGFGLSYTTFEYGNLQLSSGTISPAETVTVSVDVKNTGTRAGDEVVQLYIHDVTTRENTAFKQLKGFKRIGLVPDETKTVDFALPFEELSRWDATTHAFVVPNDAFDILVGSSSADIRDSGQITPSTTSRGPGMSKKADYSIAKTQGGYHISLTGSEPCRLDIFLPNGRRVLSFERTGPGKITWRPAAPGLYLIKLTQGKNRFITRLMVSR